MLTSPRDLANRGEEGPAGGPLVRAEAPIRRSRPDAATAPGTLIIRGPFAARTVNICRDPLETGNSCGLERRRCEPRRKRERSIVEFWTRGRRCSVGDGTARGVRPARSPDRVKSSGMTAEKASSSSASREVDGFTNLADRVNRWRWATQTQVSHDVEGVARRQRRPTTARPWRPLTGPAGGTARRALLPRPSRSA
jgi:hypothetical protein